MKYILNSAVLTSYGTWRYEPWSVEDARAFVLAGCYSTIGYAETATALEVLLGLEAGAIPVNRRQIRMESGDQALVFRLVLPPGSPRINPQDKGQIAGHISAGDWELGLLTCL